MWLPSFIQCKEKIEKQQSYENGSSEDGLKEKRILDGFHIFSSIWISFSFYSLFSYYMNN